ncbi:hypothetical protein X971_2390 [Agrobacterium tumefaciens LBA4213 (Ach5)]|nr:hypothetical protein X971_2390 [Agrobacterium tumefaciens LBA4213 (Ach5)]
MICGRKIRRSVLRVGIEWSMALSNHEIATKNPLSPAGLLKTAIS